VIPIRVPGRSESGHCAVTLEANRNVTETMEMENRVTVAF
jgi:hypothetical protein